ncbi:MAG: transglutaminase-like domain-containing protein [Lentisphaerales bacterium]|nr:transglutaminase-like domain-containing protein [Lentisphaerales bacterium]
MSAVFALPGLHTVQLPEVYMSALGVLGVRPGVAEGNRKYTVYSSAYDYGDLQIDKSLMFGYPGDEYLALPSGAIIDKIKVLNEKIINSKMSLLQRMDALKGFLAKNCKYSLKVENKSGKEPLDNFLFHERKGHCLLYASAFTIMLRQAGIPARMVNGFAGGSYDKRNDLFVMKSSNAHAWTEVFFNRYGWVAVDSTPEADNIQPNTTQLEEFDESDFTSLNTSAEARAKAKSNLPFFLQDTDSVVLAVCVLLVILSYSWQYLRRIPAFAVRKKPDAVQRFSPKPDFILEFEKLCLLEGVKLSKAKTPKEMLSEIIAMQGADEQLQSMVDYYYNLRFAEGERAQDKESNWESCLAARVKQAKSRGK